MHGYAPTERCPKKLSVGIHTCPSITTGFARRRRCGQAIPVGIHSGCRLFMYRAWLKCIGVRSDPSPSGSRQQIVEPLPGAVEQGGDIGPARQAGGVGRSGQDESQDENDDCNPPLRRHLQTSLSARCSRNRHGSVAHGRNSAQSIASSSPEAEGSLTGEASNSSTVPYSRDPQPTRDSLLKTQILRDSNINHGMHESRVKSQKGRIVKKWA